MYMIHQKSFASYWQKWADLDDPVIWSAVSGLYTVTNGWFCLLGDAYLWSCVISSSRRVLSVAIAAINIIQSGIGLLARIASNLPDLDREGALLSSGRPYSARSDK